MNTKTYVAIIGDIRDSKRMSPDQRLAVQRHLQAILSSINCAYPEHIAAKFLITLGDEFQGLLKDAQCLLGMLKAISDGMEALGVGIRYGIGMGTVSTDINKEMAIGADGPAFYCARNAIIEARQRERAREIARTSIVLKLAGGTFAQEMANIVNHLFVVQLNIKHRWTKRQKTIVDAYVQAGMNQQECAKRLGISSANVSKQINAADYYVYDENESLLQMLLVRCVEAAGGKEAA